MDVTKSVIITIVLSNAFFSDAYRILGIFPFNVKSHFIMFEQLMKGLAKRGHQVDVASVYPLKQPFPNYNDIITLSSNYGNPTNNVTIDDLDTFPVLEFVATIAGNELCEELGNSQILNLVHNPPKDSPYDLLITEIFGAQCFIAIGELLKIPVIGVSSAELYPWMNDIIANPENLGWVPNIMIENAQETMLISSFWWRLYNTVHTAYMKIRFNYLTNPQDDIIRKHLGPEIPGVRELESTLALILVNSHISLTSSKPITPALIEVGGLHIHDDDSVLSSDVEQWLNEADDGFVYLSFGSMVKIESFPKETLDIFFRCLRKIAPVRVLMKITNRKELPPNIPENILVLSWLPQVKVLKHPKIKAFISHGGLMGTQEAIYYGVPMIGIPLFADQFRNINNYVAKNIAIKLNFKSMTEKDMDNALDEILHNPIYKNSIKQVSDKFRDRPQSPLDTACYWVEYVIRYGRESLKSKALDLIWWQVALLDVYGFLLLTAITFLFIICVVIKKAINVIFSTNYTKMSENFAAKVK